MDGDIKALKEQIAWLIEQNEGLRHIVRRYDIESGNVSVYPLNFDTSQYGLGMMHLVKNKEEKKED